MASSSNLSARQTASFLIRRFKEAGLHPDTRRGQNFLIDLNLVRLLADSAELTSDDVVLEVGTGMGSLTALMAPCVGAVVTVEIDRYLYQLAAEELLDFDNVTMLQQDALKNKNTLHPALIAAVEEQLAAAPGRRLKLVSNLPYNIANAHSLQFARDVCLAVFDDRHDSKRAGRPDHGAPADQGLQRTELLDAGPVPDTNCASHATDRFLAAAQGGVRDHPDCSRHRAAPQHLRSGVLSSLCAGHVLPSTQVSPQRHLERLQESTRQTGGRRDSRGAGVGARDARRRTGSRCHAATL